MSGKPSSIGFGFQPFGHFPFGHADWAEEVTWGITPQFYKIEDARQPFAVPEPLRKFINAIKPALQEIRNKYDQYSMLWDANLCPIDQLQSLAYNFNITLNPNKSERLQRSEVLNAIQFFLHKGQDRGYEIAAALSGLLVVVTPLWADTCDASANLQLAGPTEYRPRFSDFSADEIPADRVYTDPYAKWPRQLFPVTHPCRSSWLKLFFYPPQDLEIENFSVIAEDIISAVERVRPIHVRIQSYRFDGPRTVGGGWTIGVNSENAATGGGWTIPVTGNLQTAGGGWTIPVVATPTP